MGRRSSQNTPSSDWLICPLCDRPIPPDLESRHHLVPKLRGGKHGPIVVIHTICHSKIHSLFSETELARVYNTIEILRKNKEIITFVKWISKRPPDFRSKNRAPKD